MGGIDYLDLSKEQRKELNRLCAPSQIDGPIWHDLILARCKRFGIGKQSVAVYLFSQRYKHDKIYPALQKNDIDRLAQERHA